MFNSSFLKQIAKKISGLTLKVFGYRLLNPEQTLKLLGANIISFSPASAIDLPAVKIIGNNSYIFEEKKATADSIYVWCCQQKQNALAIQLNNGSIKINQSVLCTDISHHSFYQGLLKRINRQKITTKVLIAPWSQFIDGYYYRGYYDFVFLVAAKLSRIKDSLSIEAFSSAIISYPLIGSQYEIEYLTLLGINPENILNSGVNDVRFDKVIIGNSGNGIYPNPLDILSLKNNIESSLKIHKKRNDRIYISRANNRKVINEPELIKLLKKFDFIIIEDKTRSIAEQVEIYKNASVIIGPHGASFSNIIWCEPGTYLFELFSPDYMPEYFRYLAEAMKLNYLAYSYGKKTENLSSRDTILMDIDVSIPEFENYLNLMFENF